jgi:RNA polymerase sigma-70 factor (ECF subfamily)
MEGMAVVEALELPLGGEGMDAAGFADWVRPHLLPMTRLARRLAGDAAADDVVQEALVRAWRRRETYDESRGAVLPWLLAITADRATRHRARRREHLELVDLATPPSEVERRLDLERAIAALPRQLRLVVELHYFLALGVAETAAVLGIAPGTVKSHLSDARAHLRRTLGDAS